MFNSGLAELWQVLLHGEVSLVPFSEVCCAVVLCRFALTFVLCVPGPCITVLCDLQTLEFIC